MVEFLAMTEISFNADELKSRLEKLSRRHILTFGVWQLERMLPNFIQFCVESGAEGTWVLKCVVSCAWTTIETGYSGRFSELTPALCEHVAPDTEGSTSIYTSSALDAAMSASNLMQYIRDGDINMIIDMSSLARDSADVFIQLSHLVHDDDEKFEESIISHPLMQIELQHQESDLLFLESLLEGDDQFFPAVLARSLAEPYGRKWL